MADSLEELLTELKDHSGELLSSLSSSEEATKQVAVLPILSQLGWDIHDVSQVYPEFPVGKGNDRVDYCLIAGQKRTFVEAKRAGESLQAERHQDQLLEYAVRRGAEIAALTNGFMWWFYLPLRPVAWSERRFFEVSLTDGEVGPTACRFREFLSRQAITDGSALRHAQGAFIERILPLAWCELCEENKESLLQFLRKRIEELSGYVPDTERVELFLNQQATALASASQARALNRGEESVREVGAPTSAGGGGAKRERFHISPYMAHSPLASIFEGLQKGLPTGEIEKRATAAGLDPLLTRRRLISDGKKAGGSMGGSGRSSRNKESTGLRLRSNRNRRPRAIAAFLALKCMIS